jgi:hypothetical protein
MVYPVISRLLGLLLLIAAGLKVYGFGVDPVARMGIFSSPAFQFTVIAFEISLGLWLLSGIQPIGSWVAVLITFFGFAGASFYQGWIGQASCGCLGNKLSVNPWYMFVVDIAAVVTLIFARPDLKPLWENRVRIARTSACVLGGYLFLLGSLAAFAHYRHGSISDALASLRSERLSVNPAMLDMGQGVPGETRDATVELANRTDQPIRIIGGTSDCSCTVLGDLPMTIPPGESRSISVQMRLPNSIGAFAGWTNGCAYCTNPDYTDAQKAECTAGCNAAPPPVCCNFYEGCILIYPNSPCEDGKSYPSCPICSACCIAF